MDDMISRQVAITAIQKAYADTVGGTDRCAVWKNVGLTNALHIMQDLPSGQTEKMQLSKEDATKGTTFDCISREDAIDAVKQHMNNVSGGNDEYYIAHRHIIELLRIVPTAEPESHREWYMKGYRDAQAVSCTDLCVDCPLFDKEKHECPRFNRVIPRAIEDSQPRWIPVTERQPYHELAIVQFSDGDFSLLQFPTAYRWKDIVAWMPLPPSYKGDEDERN